MKLKNFNNSSTNRHYPEINQKIDLIFGHCHFIY